MAKLELAANANAKNHTAPLVMTRALTYVAAATLTQSLSLTSRGDSFRRTHLSGRAHIFLPSPLVFIQNIRNKNYRHFYHSGAVYSWYSIVHLVGARKCTSMINEWSTSGIPTSTANMSGRAKRTTRSLHLAAAWWMLFLHLLFLLWLWRIPDRRTFGLFITHQTHLWRSRIIVWGANKQE